MADGSLIFDTKIDESGFKNGLSRLGSVANTAIKGVATVVAGAGAAVAAVGTAALKASIEFESAFAGVRKTVDATEQEFAALEKGIRDMSKHMPQSASNIARVAEAAGQLGIETKNILGFTETMIMLGDATNMTSDQAATALARLANITQMSQKDFDRLGSTIVELGNNLATTEAEIVEMGLRLAGTGTQVGLSEAQILALAGAMSSVGINAEAGGSAMSRVLQKINTQVLSSGGKLQAFAKIAGKSAKDFASLWREDPQQAINDFIIGLNKVAESGGDVTSTLKDLGINSVQEIDTLLRLAGASDVLVDSFKMANQAWEENTALTKEAEQRYKTTESQIGILKNNVMDLAISIGDELKESMRGAIDTSIEMTQRLSDAFNKGGFAGLVSELGNVIADVLTKIAGELPKFVDMGKDLIINFLNGINENRQQLVESVIEIAKSLVNAILEIMPELFETGILLMQELGRGIIDALPSLIAAAQDCIETLLTVLIDGLPLLLDMGVQILLMLVKGIAEMMPTLITQAIDLIILIADTLISHIDAIINAGIQIIIAIVQGIVENLPKLIEEVPRIINSFANAIYNNLPTVLKAGVQIILMLIKGLIQSIPTIVKNLPQIIMAIVNVFTLYNWTQLGKNLMKWLGEGIVNMRGNLLNIGKSIAEGVTNAIKNLFKPGTNIGRGLVNNLITGIKSLFSSIVSTASNLASSVIKSITNIFKGAPNIGKSLVQGLWNGINNMTGWILDRIKGFGKSIMNGIKKVFGIASPSKLMRDEIGKNLTLGIGVGLEEGMPELQRDIDKELSRLTAKMKATVEFESANIGTRIAAGNEKNIGERVVETINDNSDNSTVITGNTFIIRQESDIEKVAQELERLRTRRRRGLGVALT